MGLQGITGYCLINLNLTEIENVCHDTDNEQLDNDTISDISYSYNYYNEFSNNW